MYWPRMRVMSSMREMNEIAPDRTIATRLTSIVAIGVFVVVSALAAGTALAQPETTTPSSSTLESLITSTTLPPEIVAKQAQRSAVMTEIAGLRERLVTEMALYQQNARRIATITAEVELARTEALEMEARERAAQFKLKKRAVQLYRSDRLGLVNIIFGSETVADLMLRFDYVLAASRHDHELIEELRIARQANLYRREQHRLKIEELTRLQNEADITRSELVTAIAQAELEAAAIGENIIALLSPPPPPPPAAGTPPIVPVTSPGSAFSPSAIIADEVFRNADAMSLAQVQSFLAAQPGELASYRGSDHAGVSKSAAEMIVDAARAWRISPKVILVTLQKEQSLLTMRNDPSQMFDGSTTKWQHAMDWATGCGATDSGRISKYFGFGNQIWYGAKSLDTGARGFVAGKQLNIDGAVITPANSATASLYRYTPHMHGNTNFWMLYWRYFGDPFAIKSAS